MTPIAKRKGLYEYEEAPSGAINLYYYKEPLMPNDTGHGFQGVLAVDAVDDVVQCSLCGWWGKTLSLHLRHVHKGYSSATYKKEFGLSPKTALCSEEQRAKMIATGYRLSEWMKKNPKANRKGLANLKKGRLKGRKHSMEQKNKTGTCPEQLLDAISQLYIKLGRRPNEKEFQKEYKGAKRAAISTTFGSWNEAVKLLGWTPMKKGQHFSYTAWTKEALVEVTVNFIKNHGRAPSRSDHRRGIFPSSATCSRYAGGLRNLIAAARRKKRHG